MTRRVTASIRSHVFNWLRIKCQVPNVTSIVVLQILQQTVLSKEAILLILLFV